MKELYVHTRLSGEYKLVANIGTDNERSTDWVPNLVLDAGLNKIGNGSQDYFAYLSVGTGTTTPDVSQTSLTAEIAYTARTSSSAVNLGSPTYAGQFTSIYTFSQGAVVGNITEMGVGSATGGSSLFSRSLIVDGSGTPTAFPVVALDQLTVFYRLTNTPVITDVTSSVSISGTSYPYTARLANATDFFSSGDYFLQWVGGSIENRAGTNFAYPSTTTIGAITSNPSGSATDLYGMGITPATYTNGNFYKDVVITLGPSLGNTAGGIGGFLINFGVSSYSAGQWQYVFSTQIPKDNTKTLNLTFRHSWGR